MTRGKGRGGGPRKARNAIGFSRDVEMKDADFVPDQRPKSKAKSFSFKTRNDSERRGRVDKNSASPPSGGTTTRSGKQKTSGTDGPPERWRLKSSNLAILAASRGSKRNNNNNDNNNRRLSTISSVSTAAQDAAGPWCDKCTSLNRQLHGYLLEVLRHGADAIGDWAYAVGASPDHMECEPAPERIIPEGFRRCSSVRHQQLCAAAAKGAGAADAQAAGTAVSGPSPGWPSGRTTVVPGTPYPGQQQQPGNTPWETSAAGVVPYAQLVSALDLAQRAQEPISTPVSGAGVALQPRQTLFAIPEHATSCVQKTGPHPQTQLPAPQPIHPPWNGAFQRLGAMYPNPGPTHGANYQWAYQQRNMSDGSSERDHHQVVVPADKPFDSLAFYEAMRGVGQGRVLQEEQDSSESGGPA